MIRNSILDEEDKLLYDEIFNASKIALKEHEKWHVISFIWLSKWINYISNGCISCFHPGPIDNHHLLEDDDQLLKGLIENRDYFIAPTATALKLYNLYNGGPEILRLVTNMSSSTISDLKIQLYPLKVNIYVVGSVDRPSPILGKDIPKTHFSLQAREKVLKFFENLIQSDDLPSGYWRLWIKTTPNSKDEEGDNDNFIQSNNNKLTLSITDRNKCWLMIRKMNIINLKMCDLPTFSGDFNGNCIEVIYEYIKTNVGVGVNSYGDSIRESSFPRYSLQNAWRDKLAIDNIVDGYHPKSNRFLEARVVEIYKEDIKLHFLGFDDDDDQICTNNEKYIMPLYSETRNWRENLKQNEFIEARYTNFSCKGKWVSCQIDAIMSGRVKVFVNKQLIEGLDRLEFEYCVDKNMYYREIDVDSEELCASGTHIKKANIADTIWNGDEKKQISPYSWSDRNTRMKPIANGVVGLANLGNTCFMNSILQCLSNTKELTQIFLDNRYNAQINRDNPLGHGGKVVEVYADLMKDIWSNAYSKISPYNFKHTIGEFKPQFSGYQQQDSQEFMSFLLDGLHEDLNRIKKKPYVKTLESKGRSDEIIAREALRRYLLRNDSEIIDLCFGQLRSHVICTNCGHESTTFDPYSSLSLPIPTNRIKFVSVLVFMLPFGSIPLKVEVEISNADTIILLKKKVLQKLMQNGNISPNSEADNIRDVTSMKDSTDNILDDKVKLDNPNKKKRLFNHATNPRCYSVMKECKSKYNNKNCEDDDSISYIGLLERDDREFTVKMFQMENESQKWIDIYLGVEDKDAYIPKATNYGLIGRVPLTEQTTNQSIYPLAARMIERFVNKSDLTHSLISEQIYTLYFGDLYNYSNLKSKIPYNNYDLERDTFSYFKNVDIVIVWSKDKIHHFLESERNNCVSINDLVNPEIQSKLNIQRCIEKYTEKEQMNEEELFFCSDCKEHKAPIKKLDLWSTPDVLILHLKRFEYIPGQYFVHREKISDFVDYPLENLDLSELVIGPKHASPIYDLYAVSEHSGGLGGGHYTAKCKNHVDNNWYSFNDSFVSETTPANAVTDLAYLLFYKRKNGSCRWGGLLPLPEADQLPDEE